MPPLFIDDGYTCTKTIPAAAGLHPEVTAEYRPALARARHAYAARVAGRDPDQIDRCECELVERHVLRLNGQPLTPDQARRLQPAVRAHLVDLVLGYAPADEAQDAKN